MKKILYTLPLLLGLAACSNDNTLTNSEPIQPTEPTGYYLTFDLTVPNTPSTISTKANDLDGTENESSITDLDLYLVDSGTKNILYKKTNITSPESSPSWSVVNGTGSYDKIYTVSLKMEESDLLQLHDLFGKEFYVMAVCNLNGKYSSPEVSTSLSKKMPSATLTDIDSEFMGDYLQTAGVYPKNQGSKLPLASAKFAEATIQTFQETSSAGTDEAKKKAVKDKFNLSSDGKKMVLNLNSIDVERCLARLDLKQNSNNTWDYDLQDGKNGGNSGIKLRLYSIVPFNVNENYYVVRHTTSGDAEAASGDPTLLGGGSWTADAFWTNSTGLQDVAPKINTWGSISFDKATKVADLSSTEDTKKRDISEGGYFPWWYVTENTNISNSEENLKTNATGVMFRFEILTNDATGAEPITKDTQSSKLPTGVTISGEGDNATLTVLLSKSGKKQTFTQNNGHFYLDYPGFITHNASGQAMHYAVVRNTAYQMAISSISNLPNAQDAEYFLELTINVLKWEKRVVNFEF